MPGTVALTDVGLESLPLVGGKGAQLGLAMRAGLPVPDGFCVTTDAYRGGMDASLEAEISAAYESMGSPPVAVRSSATAEDLPDASFAGQQDTYLGVAGVENVLDAVHRCWASLWTDRAVVYRSAQGVDGAGVALAVVVQRMVDAAVAGVLFTADPVTGRRGFE